MDGRCQVALWGGWGVNKDRGACTFASVVHPPPHPTTAQAMLALAPIPRPVQATRTYTAGAQSYAPKQHCYLGRGNAHTSHMWVAAVQTHALFHNVHWATCQPMKVIRRRVWLQCVWGNVWWRGCSPPRK